MKPFLKTVFALVLIAFVAVSAYAADFTDEDNIQNRAAVIFLRDLGLIRGYTDGSFRPRNNVQRSEAAKLAAMICESNPTPAQASDYRDVPRSHWAAPYIDYCAQKGIVSGEGGRFRPDGYLTGRELAKILLACVGFDGRQYTGGNWAEAVDRDAKLFGLYAGIEANPASMISRDNVCRMIYNAVQCPAVIGKDAKGEPIYATDELLNPITYMEYRFHVVKFSGVVTGNEYADLTQKDGRLPQGQTVLRDHAPFAVSTDYTALGRTAELSAIRTVVGNDVFYSVLGIPTIRQEEKLFTVDKMDDYVSILRYSGAKTNAGTEYYLNGNREDEDFLIRLGKDCEISGIDRNGDGVLDAVLAYNYLPGTVVSPDPLRVSVSGMQTPAVASEGASDLTSGAECRCLLLGGVCYIVP